MKLILMKSSIVCSIKSLGKRAADSWLRLTLLVSGAAALVWFLVRVIPKPSRASYPCQRAAFPVASGFVIWLCGAFAIKAGMGRIGRGFGRHRLTAACVGGATILAIAGWTLATFSGHGLAQTNVLAAAKPPIDWNFVPAKPNTPVGVARGINPGRVVWARDPLATKWAGNWKQKSDQWWLDENTDQSRVDALLAATLTKLTSATNGGEAWRKLFEYYNKTSRQMDQRGYQPGEVVAVKINLNNSTKAAKTDNFIDASPQMVLAMVRQLVNQAHVRPEDILVYDARRFIPPYLLTKVWSEFQDVRFVQNGAAQDPQPKHPVYGDYRRLEAANWVEGIAYSNGKYKDAKLIPKQVFDATYLVNLAILKSHSYPAQRNGWRRRRPDRPHDDAAKIISARSKARRNCTRHQYPAGSAKPHLYSPIVDSALRRTWAGKPFCTCWTDFTAAASGSLIRSISRIRRSTTASRLMKIRTGRRACWPRWTAWRWIRSASIFFSRRPKTTTTRRATRAFCPRQCG